MGHDNFFPNANGDPYRSLEMLYPAYIGAEYLAGLSGNERQAKLALSQGGHLNSNVCSLVYAPGLLLTNDEEIAVVWERRSGLAFNGRHWPGRSVGFISGKIRQIPDTEWSTFLSNQTKLREAASRGQ